eukprot:c6098_g1_i1.p1 GENE.c6098_g1_i1~~c6098_g1_i1.p1  ORF type:complete len:312 (+),score=66.99 c6098_g1_i1:1-936(+)
MGDLFQTRSRQEMDDYDESIERTVFVGKECFVYKIPPRGPNGYAANDWKESDFLWKGRVRVTEQGDKCEIRLEDPINGNLFASCPVNGELDKVVERTHDSSRYFVLRVSNNGKTALLGMGFQERNDSFDFNVALEDHMKDVRRRQEEKLRPTPQPGNNFAVNQQPSLNLGLKDGQTFKVNIKTSSSGRRTRNDEAAVILPPPTTSARSRDLPPISAPASSNANAFDSFLSATPAPAAAPAPAFPSFAPATSSFASTPAAFSAFAPAAPAVPQRAAAPPQPTKNDFFDALMAPAAPAQNQSQSNANPFDFLN